MIDDKSSALLRAFQLVAETLQVDLDDEGLALHSFVSSTVNIDLLAKLNYSR